jgi:hypothetical protein
VIGTKNVFGVDVVDEGIRLSISKGIKVVKFDLNEEFKFYDNFFNVINANQFFLLVILIKHIVILLH